MALAIINSLMALNSLNERKLLEAEIRRNDEKYDEAVNEYIISKSSSFNNSGFNDFLLLDEFKKEAELLKKTEKIKPSNLDLGDRDENTWAFTITLIINLLLIYLLIVFHKTTAIKPNNI